MWTPQLGGLNLLSARYPLSGKEFSVAKDSLPRPLPFLHLRIKDPALSNLPMPADTLEEFSMMGKYNRGNYISKTLKVHSIISCAVYLVEEPHR